MSWRIARRLGLRTYVHFRMSCSQNWQGGVAEAVAYKERLSGRV